MTLVKWKKTDLGAYPLPHPRSQAVPTLVRPAHLQAEAQGTGPGGLMVRGYGGGGGLGWTCGVVQSEEGTSSNR